MLKIHTKMSGLAEFQRYMKGLRGRIDNPGRAMRACAVWAAARVRSYFRSAAERARDGISWRPKSSLWAAWTGTDRPLVHTGRLRDSISYASDTQTFAYGTNVEYAARHNEGVLDKKTIFVTIAPRPGLRSGFDDLKNYRLAPPDAPGAKTIKVEQRVFKREFIVYPPPPAYIRQWQEILGKYFIHGRTG